MTKDRVAPLVPPNIYQMRRQVRVPDMEITQSDPETVAAMQRIALSIFTDMVNSGRTLAEALSAIYMSGLSHAVDIIRERDAA